MSITNTRAAELKCLSHTMRNELLDLLHDKQTGHPGGSLSCCEILTALYFYKLNIDPHRPEMADRDRLVLSKGHAAPMLYLCLAHRGFFPLSEMTTFRQLGSSLQGHPCTHKTPGIDLSTGPLGLGLSAATGMAEAARINGLNYNVYVILGDGEIQEGAVWEAAMTANKYQTANLIAILDYNGVQLDGTNDEIMPVRDPGERFAAFGWKVFHADGHDIAALAKALNQADGWRDGPAIIIARTVKGKGVTFMEGKSTWHGRPIADEEYRLAKKELGGEAE